MTFLGLPEPVVHYQFGCNDHGLVSVVDSGPFMETLVAHHKNPPMCHLSSNGMVSAAPLQSNSTFQGLQQVSGHSKGFAIEIWMTFLPLLAETGADHSRPILTIGSPTNNTVASNGDDEDDDDCAGFEVALAQRGQQLELRYVDYKDTQELCRVLIVRQHDLEPHVLQQVLVLWLDGETYVYLDGLAILQGAPNDFDTTLSRWDPLSRLELFGRPQLDPQDNDTFQGSLNMISIYNQALKEEDVAELYRQGEAMLKLARRQTNPLRIEMVDVTSVHVLSQGSTTSITIGDSFTFDAADTTAPGDWSLGVEISMLPRFGSLYASEILTEETLLGNQSLLSLDNLNRTTTLWYHPDREDFFNAPSFAFNGTSLAPQRESFSYRIVAVAGGTDLGSSSVVAASEVVEQEVIVIHVNHPPELKAPQQIRVDEEQPTGVGARPRAHLDAVQVLDAADYNIDRIRVDLWARNGTLVIDEDYLSLADFASCRAAERLALLGSGAVSWGCHGNGVANRNMTFVAIPDDVSQILSHVQYHGFHWNQEDEVVIRLYDGVDGPCLSQEEHRRVQYPDQRSKYHTIHNEECFEVVARVQIPAISMEDNFDSSGGYLKALFDFDDFGVADGIFWGVFLLLLLVCCLSIRTCIRCFGMRGAKIHVEAEPTIILRGEAIV